MVRHSALGSESCDLFGHGGVPLVDLERVGAIPGKELRPTSEHAGDLRDGPAANDAGARLKLTEPLATSRRRFCLPYTLVGL